MLCFDTQHITRYNSSYSIEEKFATRLVTVAKTAGTRMLSCKCLLIGPTALDNEK